MKKFLISDQYLPLVFDNYVIESSNSLTERKPDSEVMILENIINDILQRNLILFILKYDILI